MRKRFGNYQMGGPVQPQGREVQPELRQPVPMPPSSPARTPAPQNKMPAIMGRPLPNPRMKQGTLGQISPPREKLSPQGYANEMASRKRMKKMGSGQGGLGSLFGRGGGKGPGQMAGPPQGQPQGSQEGSGEQWLGQIWNSLGSGPPQPNAPGYQSGGAVTGLGATAMNLYNQTMADLESGGIGYARGGLIGQNASPVPETQGVQQANYNNQIGSGQGNMVSSAPQSTWEKPVPQIGPDNQSQFYAHGGAVSGTPEDLASYGRNGDSMLMHVNPAEVAGLESIMPLTRNPDTGFPEAFAFMPFLIGAALGATAGGAMSDWDPKAMALGGLGGGFGLGGLLGGGAAAASGPAIAGAGTSLASTTAIPTGAGLAGVPGIAWGPASSGLANVAVGGAGTAAPGAVTASQLAAAKTAASGLSKPAGGFGKLSKNMPKIAEKLFKGQPQKRPPQMSMAQPQRGSNRKSVLPPPKGSPRPELPSSGLASLRDDRRRMGRG